MRLLSVFCLLCLISFAVNAVPIDLGSVKKQATDDPRIEQANQSYRLAIKELAADRLDSAEQAFKQTYEYYPTVYAVLGMAEIAFKRKDMKKARELIEQALREAPNDAHVQDSWGRLLFIDQKYAESETALKKAVQIDPGMVRSYIALGDLYLTIFKKPELAIPAYQSALKVEPGHTGAMYALGVAQRQSGNYKDAETQLQHVIAVEKDNPLPKNELARLYVDQKQYDQALAIWNGLLQQNGKYIDAYYGRASVYLAQNNPGAAIKEFQDVLKIVPQHADAQLKLGMVYQGMSNWTEAETAYLAAIKAQPNLALAYNNLAWMSADKGENLDQALVWAKKAVELQPAIPDFLDTLGWVHRARAEYGPAIESINSAIASVKRPGLYYHLGVIQFEKGDSAAAIAALNEALKTGNQFADAEKARQLLDKIQAKSN